MVNYKESKKEIDKIRSKYNCAGDLIFRTALDVLMGYGTITLLDNNKYELLLIQFSTSELAKAVMNCAHDLCKIDTTDLMIYIQKEIWLGGDGIDYHRSIKLLKNCMEFIADPHMEYNKVLEEFDYIGLTDDEIEELGFGYLFEEEEDDL